MATIHDKISQKLFRVLADGVRLKIIKLLSRGPMRNSEILNALSIDKTSLSKHLKTLKANGIIKSYKIGRELNFFLAEGVCQPTNQNTVLKLPCCEIQIF